MSSSIQSSPSPGSEFQAYFGAPPGTKDAQAECKQWEHLCAALIVERARLQAELSKAQAENEANLRSLAAQVCKDFKLEVSMQEMYAQVDKEISFEQFIAELEQEPEKKA